ncbi:MAG TPA: SURF1 family protein [Burkholderiales bacterium]|nr:SURF1 family protein [Burkholderiales bacterium]
MKREPGQTRCRNRRPAWIPAVAAAAGIALTAAAGNWQLNRAHEKERLQAEYERGAAGPPILLSTAPVSARDLRFRRVEADGEFVAPAMVLLDNRVRDGRAGYEVVMPVKLKGSAMHVLVDRGWIAAGPDRSVLPEVATPAGPVKITGVATVPGRFLELSSATAAGRVWQNLTIERYREYTGLAVQPVVVRQDNELDDGLLRARERPDFGIGKHYGYAGQWFIFCGLIAVLYAYFHVKSTRSKKSQAHDPAPGGD